MIHFFRSFGDLVAKLKIYKFLTCCQGKTRAARISAKHTAKLQAWHYLKLHRQANNLIKKMSYLVMLMYELSCFKGGLRIHFQLKNNSNNGRGVVEGVTVS